MIMVLARVVLKSSIFDCFNLIMFSKLTKKRKINILTN